MNLFKATFKIFLGIFLAICVSGNVRGQTWQETTTIVPGEEYLIGFVSGNNVYLAVSYAPNESSHYYTSDNNTNWRGYTSLANFSGNNIVGVSGYADDLQYCTWIFNGDAQNGYTIQSVYNENYYLRTWSSLSYDDLYPDNTTSNATSWKYQNGALYRTIDNTNRYAQYYYLDNTNIGPHMSVTSTQLINNVRLYTNPNICHKPINLQVSNITTNSVHITWESENTNFQWSLDNSTWTNITGTSIDLSNLTSNIPYTFYIRTDCGNNNLSSSINTSFTTLKPREQCQVGDNWGNETFGYLPSYSLYNYSLTEQIYTAEEIGNSGIIGRISFYNTTNVSPNYTRYLNIYLIHTNKDEFEDNTDWINTTNNDLVFSGEVTMNLNDWTEIILDNTFNYNGIDNLALIINDTYGEWHSTMNYNVYTSSKNQSLYVYQDGSAYSAINPPSDYGTLSNKKNQIKLCTEEGWTLPINLLEFSAEPRYDHQTGVHVLNLLTIRTGYEYNNCEFIVYRSEDAINWDYDIPVCNWDFGQDSAIYNEALDTVLNYFTIEHPNGQTYYPVDTIPYPVTYYKLIQRDCDNTTTEYTSEIIVCIANQQKNLIEPYVICDNRPQVVGGSEVCEVFIQNILGQVVEEFQLQPYQQREVLAKIQGMYLITFVYKYNGEARKKTEKIVCM